MKLESYIFNVYKPSQMTSNDVVAIIKKILNTKKVGHGGTLDPMATGVLPVFTGPATRLLEYSLEGTKEYIAQVKLGVKTDTGDITGKVLQEAAVPAISEEKITGVFAKFIGKQLQTPPMYSALKVNGKKLYQLARKGQEVERTPREIEIFALELLGFDQEGFRFRVECSKGTYIRVLTEELAEGLGTVGTLAKLTRSKVANFTLAESHTLDEIRDNPEACSMNILDILPLPRLTLTAKQAWRLTSGVPTTLRGTADGCYVMLAPSGEQVLGIADVLGEVAKVRKVMQSYANPEQTN